MSGDLLILDDDHAILRLFDKVLSAKGYQVRTTDTVAACMAAASERVPDLAILDVMLPNESGFDCCEQLLEAYPELPIIFVTASNDPSDCFARGAVDYIRKPVKQAELLARINTHIRLNRYRRDLELAMKALKLVNEGMAAKIEEGLAG